MPNEHAEEPPELIADDLAIRRLSHEYAVALDTDDRARWRALFAPHIALESGDTVRGYADVLRIPEDQLRRYDRTIHLVTTQRIDLHGDTASGIVYCTAHHLYRDHHQNGRFPFDLDHAFLIRYEDEYARIDGRWLFTRRRICTEARWVQQVIPPPVDAANDETPGEPGV
jgi:hypothetical protein